MRDEWQLRARACVWGPVQETEHTGTRVALVPPRCHPRPGMHAICLLCQARIGSQQRQERMGQKSPRPSDDTTREQGFRNQEHVAIPPAVPDDHEPEFGLRNIVRSAVARCHTFKPELWPGRAFLGCLRQVLKSLAGFFFKLKKTLVNFGQKLDFSWKKPYLFISSTSVTREVDWTRSII